MEKKNGNGEAGGSQAQPMAHKSRHGHTLTRSLAVAADDEGLAGSSESGPTPTPPPLLGCSSPSLDLLQFIQQTINKNTKDRNLILRTEAELLQFINSGSHSLPLPGPYSSYQRLLIHRVAAYFKLEHNLDATGSGIVISRGTDSPLHDSERRKFRDLIQATTGADDFNDPHRRARKFATPRPPLHDQYQQMQQGWTTGQRILKMASFEGSERRAPAPPLHLAKAYSFGGYGRSQGQSSSSGRGGGLSAQTSLSPASSGYKSTSFPSMELRTPSPAGPYFAEEASPQAAAAHALHEAPPLQHLVQSQNTSQDLVLWAVSDIKSVPPNAVIIDPNTMTPVRYQTEGVHHHGGGTGGPLPQQGQILQQQYYPMIQQPVPAPLHPTYLPVHNYCEHGSELGNWFAGMSLSPGQYYAAQPQSCGPPVQPQPAVYFPQTYNYYTPRAATGPPPQRFYYGQGMAAPPNYVQPGIIFQPPQHPHQHPPEQHHMAGASPGQSGWYNMTSPGQSTQVTGAYGPRNGHSTQGGGSATAPNTHTHPHPLSSHHKNKYRK